MSRSDAPGREAPASHLLAALPPWEYQRLRPLLEDVPLPAGAVLYETGQPIRHVHFPTAGVLSLLSSPQGRGEGIEVGVVGREGMAGLPVFLGARTAPTRCVVQVTGAAVRMRADHFRTRVHRDGALHGLLLHYTHAFLNQVSQTVACNALHSVPKRLARWVLTVHVRAGADSFRLTHAFLAAMLGVRRASVTEAARKLQQAGLIRYVRGLFTILDRPGLEASACDCHRLIEAAYGRPDR
jgi:CRP-like cAMP-binding protein